MERVLYLFFNVDTSKAEIADQLRKDITRYESNTRNTQWDVTQIRKQITDLNNKLDPSTQNDKVDDVTIEKHQNLSNKLSECLDLIQRINYEIKECDLNISDSSLNASALKHDYEIEFSKSMAGTLPVDKDPIIVEFINSIKNEVCSDGDPYPVFEEMLLYIKKEKCSVINPISFDMLREIDDKIAKYNQEINKNQERKSRLLIEINR